MPTDHFLLIRKKVFVEYSKAEHEKQRQNNYFDRIDERVASEEYKHMASLLEPLNMVSQFIFLLS